jgi:PhzF family phenazine biosynthesis protein
MPASLPLYQIDAFADRLFAGNPAAVCPLDAWLPERVMQDIATENNLSETAYMVPRGNDFDIRWFTPKAEIELAGHPTLAAAYLILTRLQPSRATVRFHSRKGDVIDVVRDGDVFSMDFPARPAKPAGDLPAVGRALGADAAEYLMGRDAVAVFDREEQVRALAPDFGKVAALGYHGVLVTAPGRDCDFVSRFFVPNMGINEDPVTGSTHCTLIPFWAARLGKDELFARQVSARGGEIFCRHRGERVTIGGRAVLYMEGRIFL